MKCDYCGKQCLCHINAPCGFCESHLECEICGKIICESRAITLTDSSDNSSIMVCEECSEEVE